MQVKAQAEEWLNGLKRRASHVNMVMQPMCYHPNSIQRIDEQQGQQAGQAGAARVGMQNFMCGQSNLVAQAFNQPQAANSKQGQHASSSAASLAGEASLGPANQ